MANGRATRNKTWSFARQCLLDAGGDHSKAEQLVRERAPREFSILWVTIAVQIALFLIKLWIDNRVSDPGETPTDDDEIFGDLEKDGARNNAEI